MRIAQYSKAVLAAVINLGIFTLQTQTAFGEPSFELPAIKIVGEWENAGRKVIRYEHDSMSQWGYETPQKDSFYLVPPKNPVKDSPLCVVLHSAGGSGDEAISAICTTHDRNFYGDDTFYVLCLDCATNRNDWWWGKKEIEKHPDLYKNELCPAEKRVLSTVEWVIRTFGIDRNRVYLNGGSMGGSGSLGIGLIRGDVFAAVSVVIPAGVKHMNFRILNSTFPEPPPLFDISSQMDSWALGQEELMAFFRENKYFISFAWGPFGHKAKLASLANPAAYEYPYLTIRKNEAYPAFTNATTDNRYPGFKNSMAPDQSGQINGYFRWRNIEDTAKKFVMELRLAKKDDLRRPVEIPQDSIADITPRRLQKFKVSKAAEYSWSMTCAENVLQSGNATADANGVLTIPAVKISGTPAHLQIVQATETGKPSPAASIKK
jgi:hypothetical protein